MGEGKKDFDFEKLEAYQRALDFANELYESTKKFPQAEQFGIVNQLRRASLSVSLNIAEGVDRYSSRERKGFYRMARSSINECLPLIEVSARQNYLDLERQKN